MSGDYTVADTLYFLFTTRRFTTGAPFTLGGSPVISAYENEGLTQITAGVSLGVDHDGVTGLNLCTVVASGANGFESGKDYHLVITTGTVDSVSVVGEVVGRFTLQRSAAAVDLANATDGLGVIKSQTVASERNVRQTIESQRGHHTACGAIFYVQKGGSDANPGTYLLPFLTIQAALNACTANAHDTVIVLGVTGSAPSVFSEALTMSKQYVFLRGMGRDTQVTTAGAASSTITISASGCEVSGLWVNNTGTGATKGVETAAGADFAWLHHLFIDGAATGVTVTAGTNVTVENCRINDVTTAGITVAQGAGVELTTRILDNHIDGTATGINFAGGDSSESIARYNNISGCTTGVVVASGALKVQVTDNRFAGNTTDWTDAGTNTNLSWNALSTNISGTVARVTLTDTATAVTTVNGLAANVITAASINADAITDAKVAADVTIASVTGSVGSVTGAVGSVTGNVGGNVTGSVGSVVGAVGSVTGAVGSVTGLTASDVGAIKAKTDSLNFTVAGNVNANIQYVNDVAVTGDGQPGTEWGPV